MALRQDSEDGVELTEKLVLARTRAPDLESVKKLNCWASQINAVSVVRKLPNLEVCSLSINKISTLRDFAHCYKLKELYVRTNRICCLGDIHYLKGLSRLRYLWLSENPCADADNYRLTVLRTLPRLQKLDNTAVTCEEVHEALSTVEEIPIPDDFSASSMFNRPLNISSVSSVSSVSLDDVLSPRSSNADLSPRESLPVARKKREQRRQRKAEEDSARRSAEEEFVRTSLERQKIEGGRRRGDGDDDDDDDGEGDDAVDDSSESVGDDVKASGDSESSESSGEKSKAAMLNSVLDEGGDDGSYEKNDEGSGVHVISNKNVKSESEKTGDCCNGDGDHSNSDAVVQKEIIIDSDGGKDRNNCNVNNNNNDEKCENVVSKKEDIDNVKTEVTGDSLLDKIRLDDSLAVDEDIADPSHDSIDLDDLVVEVSEDNQTLTNQEGLESDGEKVKDNIGDFVEKMSVGESEKKEENSIENSVADPDADQCESDPSIADASSPRMKTDSDKKTTVSPRKESVDWEQYNRMRQDIGMKPIESRPASSRPLSANVAKARNGNILQAVLSLVKELDKDSLELVASAVKVRIDGL